MNKINTAAVLWSGIQNVSVLYKYMLRQTTGKSLDFLY